MHHTIATADNSSTRKPLQLKCTAHYDPETVMYTVNATWDLTGQHPLVKEALLLYPFHVNAYRFIQFAQGMRVEENNFTHKIQVKLAHFSLFIL